ncbi:hypothetical protein JYU20_01760 [Bacteroidales bacterium AH-315-I05]|nr:hypothetical protein [Bacteroidales bacterium AH-315-I05]
MQKAIISILLVLFAFASFSQKVLVLSKPGKTKKIFETGDELHFKLKNDNILFSGIINEITDSTVMLGNDIISIRRISVVRDSQRGFQLQKYSKRFIAFGITAFVFNTIYNLTSEESAVIIDASTIIISGGFLLSGYLMSLIKKGKKYRLNKKLKLRVIEK